MWEDDEVDMPRFERNGGRNAMSSMVGKMTDIDFSTCTSNRKGMGGRATVGKYGLKYLELSRRNYAPITLEVMQRRYVRLDKDTLLYIADEDLHVYDGKESVRARKDVGYIWVRVSEPVERTLSWYDNENYDLD